MRSLYVSKLTCNLFSVSATDTVAERRIWPQTIILDENGKLRGMRSLGD